MCSCLPSPRGARGRVRIDNCSRKSVVLGRFRPGSGGQFCFIVSFALSAAGIRLSGTCHRLQQGRLGWLLGPHNTIAHYRRATLSAGNPPTNPVQADQNLVPSWPGLRSGKFGTRFCTFALGLWQKTAKAGPGGPARGPDRRATLPQTLYWVGLLARF